MKILGIDPGPAESGWMTLVKRAKGVQFANCGNVLSKRDAFIELLDVESPDVVSIERPKWQDHGKNAVATRAIASNLIETNYVVARFAEIAVARGMKLIEIPAQTWRLGLLRSRSPSDAQIKRVVVELVHGLPSRTNAHERDAGGVALAALRVVGTRAEGPYVASF